MALQELTLENFRNYHNFHFPFSNQHTIFYGPNGIGKTNLLEALYVVSTWHSFRSTKLQPLIHDAETYARITVAAPKDAEKNNLEFFIGLTQQSRIQKQYKHNGLKKKPSQTIGLLPVVLFSPEQTTLMILGPEYRRRRLNHLMFQVAPEFTVAALEYGEVIRQRNALLQNPMGYQKADLAFWDEKLVTIGSRIVFWRHRHIAALNEHLSTFNEKLSNIAQPLVMHYQPSIGKNHWEDEAAVAKDFWDALENNRAAEQIRKRTLIGPQRDDWFFQLNENPIAEFGSRGQLRTALLALLFAEAEVIEKELKITPLVLLDDVFSELDQERRHLLPHLIGRRQAVISSTDPLDNEKDFEGLEQVDLLKKKSA